MDLSPDLIDALVEFENFGVEYLVIGGWAVRALAAFGAPAELLREAERMTAEEFFFFGTPPARIDLLRSIPGVTFEEAWPRRARARWGTITVNLIGLDDLIAAKLAAGRPQDLVDLELLQAVKRGEHF